MSARQRKEREESLLGILGYIKSTVSVVIDGDTTNPISLPTPMYVKRKPLMPTLEFASTRNANSPKTITTTTTPYMVGLQPSPLLSSPQRSILSSFRADRGQKEKLLNTGLKFRKVISSSSPHPPFLDHSQSLLTQSSSKEIFHHPQKDIQNNNILLVNQESPKLRTSPVPAASREVKVIHVAAQATTTTTTTTLTKKFATETTDKEPDRNPRTPSLENQLEFFQKSRRTLLNQIALSKLSKDRSNKPNISSTAVIRVPSQITQMNLTTQHASSPFIQFNQHHHHHHHHHHPSSQQQFLQRQSTDDSMMINGANSSSSSKDYFHQQKHQPQNSPNKKQPLRPMLLIKDARQNLSQTLTNLENAKYPTSIKTSPRVQLKKHLLSTKQRQKAYQETSLRVIKTESSQSEVKNYYSSSAIAVDHLNRTTTTTSNKAMSPWTTQSFNETNSNRWKFNNPLHTSPLLANSHSTESIPLIAIPADQSDKNDSEQTNNNDNNSIHPANQNGLQSERSTNQSNNPTFSQNITIKGLLKQESNYESTSLRIILPNSNRSSNNSRRGSSCSSNHKRQNSTFNNNNSNAIPLINFQSTDSPKNLFQQSSFCPNPITPQSRKARHHATVTLGRTTSNKQQYNEDSFSEVSLSRVDSFGQMCSKFSLQVPTQTQQANRMHLVSSASRIRGCPGQSSRKNSQHQDQFQQQQQYPSSMRNIQFNNSNQGSPSMRLLKSKMHSNFSQKPFNLAASPSTPSHSSNQSHPIQQNIRPSTSQIQRQQSQSTSLQLQQRQQQQLQQQQLTTTSQLQLQPQIRIQRSGMSLLSPSGSYLERRLHFSQVHEDNYTVMQETLLSSLTANEELSQYIEQSGYSLDMFTFYMMKLYIHSSDIIVAALAKQKEVPSMMMPSSSTLIPSLTQIPAPPSSNRNSQLLSVPDDSIGGSKPIQRKSLQRSFTLILEQSASSLTFDMESISQISSAAGLTHKFPTLKVNLQTLEFVREVFCAKMRELSVSSSLVRAFYECFTSAIKSILPSSFLKDLGGFDKLRELIVNILEHLCFETGMIQMFDDPLIDDVTEAAKHLLWSDYHLLDPYVKQLKNASESTISLISNAEFYQVKIAIGQVMRRKGYDAASVLSVQARVQKQRGKFFQNDDFSKDASFKSGFLAQVAKNKRIVGYFLDPSQVMLQQFYFLLFGCLFDDINYVDFVDFLEHRLKTDGEIPSMLLEELTASILDAADTFVPCDQQHQAMLRKKDILIKMERIKQKAGIVNFDFLRSKTTPVLLTRSIIDYCEEALVSIQLPTGVADTDIIQQSFIQEYLELVMSPEEQVFSIYDMEYASVFHNIRKFGFCFNFWLQALEAILVPLTTLTEKEKLDVIAFFKLNSFML